MSATTHTKRASDANTAAVDPAAGKAQLIDVTRAAPEAAVSELVGHAVDTGASDLYFTSNEQHVAALIRHLGIVRPISILPLELGRRCLAHVKAKAGMDTTEKRRPLDGRWMFERDDADAVDLR